MSGRSREKVNRTVKRETLYIAGWVLVFSVLMQAVFLLLRRWDYTVLLGNLLSGTAAVLNFLLMGITVQRALQKEEKQAANLIKASQAGRMLLLFGVAAVGLLLPYFHPVAVLLPLFFPRIAIALRPLFMKKQEGENDEKEV